MALPKDRPIATTARRSRRDRAVRLSLMMLTLIFGYLTVIAAMTYAVGFPLILMTLLICLMLDAQSELRLMDRAHCGVTIVIVTVVWITIVLRGYIV